MIPAHLQALAKAEDTHWWFVARRRIIARVLQSLPRPGPWRIFDIGCGPGGNLEMLARFGEVAACETDAAVRGLAQQRGFRVAEGGRLPEELPYAGETFDLVTLLDVLEHVGDDRAGLVAIRPRLAPNGWLVVTVPAFQWLWSAHDEGSHHLRRYTRTQLGEVLRAAGYRNVTAGYFNFWLFPLACLAKWFNRKSRDNRVPGLAVPPAPLNRLLTAIMASEAARVMHGGWPWGVSIVAWAQPTLPTRPNPP